jgi:hypothetical protein
MSIRVLVLLVGLAVIGKGEAQAVTSPLAVEAGHEILGSKAKDTIADATVGPNPGLSVPPGGVTAERAASANPLWTIPLGSLTATRERPLFSQSRRPPPRVVAAKPPAQPPPPPKPAEPEKPQLSLVGTVVGETGEGIGLFMSLTERTALRLKIGEDHKGWILREVRSRQVVLEKGQQIATLELPRHDLSKGGSVPPAAPTAVLPAPPPAPTAVLSTVPPAPTDVPPNRTTGAVVDEVAATSSSPVNSPKAKGGFRFPPPSAGSEPTAEQPTIIVQQPVISFPEPFVNPFQKAGLP